MGLKTDFVSLGAIGLGTAVAVIGTGGVLIAGALHQGNEVNETASCVDVAIADLQADLEVAASDLADFNVTAIASFDGSDLDASALAEVVEVVQISEAPTRFVVGVSDEIRDVAKAPQAPEAPAAPAAPKVMVSSDVRVEIGECADQIRATIEQVRAGAEVTRLRAGQARVLADELRIEADLLRSEAEAVREGVLFEVERARANRR